MNVRIRNIEYESNSNNQDSCYLAIIIPYRYSSDREDAFERAESLLTMAIPSGVKFYLVDSGSPRDEAQKMKRLCIQKNAEYIYVDTQSEIFSAGKARDIGSIYANAKYLFFQDIDLLPYQGFYDELLSEIETQKLKERNEDFIVVPCLYLTEKGSIEYKNTDSNKRKDLFFQYLSEDRTDICLNLAPGSSAIVVNRLHYLSIGGHDKDFYGHGFEDFELVHRLTQISNRFYRPFKYYDDFKRWNLPDYQGFRSLYRLRGDLLLNKGIYLAHIWHKPIKDNSEYVNKNKENKKILVDKMKEFDQSNQHPKYLPDIYRGKTLALGRVENAFYRSLWQINPSLGELLYKPETEFENKEEILNYIKDYKVDRVLMPNPYGNEKRLSLYKILKESKIPIIVSDRGALNKSVFFDPHGFNADSSSYNESKWNIPLTDEESKQVKSYIRNEYFSDDALEEQGKRIGGDRLAKKLNIHNKKVLFVPFQRPSDTVIKYFSGSVNGVEEFSDFVVEVSRLLGDDWVVIAKKHPLEKNHPTDKIEFVDDNTHIKDLIELSDALLLINSGVGVLSMMWYKPVFYVGEVFYGFDGINKHIKSPSLLVDELNNLFKVNHNKVHRFIYYLINEFYSFGQTKSEIIERVDGSKFNVTREIDFQQIILPNCEPRNYIRRVKPDIPFSSPLFDRYRSYLIKVASKNKNALSKKKIVDKGKTTKEKVTKEKVENNKTKQSIKQVDKRIVEIKVENWFLRQITKLIFSPSNFKKQYKRWKIKRKNQAEVAVTPKN